MGAGTLLWVPGGLALLGVTLALTAFLAFFPFLSFLSFLSFFPLSCELPLSSTFAAVCALEAAVMALAPPTDCAGVTAARGSSTGVSANVGGLDVDGSFVGVAAGVVVSSCVAAGILPARLAATTLCATASPAVDVAGVTAARD